MGLFTQYVDQKPAVNAALGSTLRINLSRDFPREGFIITVRGKVTTTLSDTAKDLGLLSIVKRARLFVNQGSSNRTLIDADGLSILQRHVHYNQSLDDETLKAYVLSQVGNGRGSTPGLGTFNVSYPHFFAPGSLGTPTRDLFLQNFPSYNNDPYLEITLKTAAEVATGIAISDTGNNANKVDVIVTEFKRVVDIPKWNFLQVSFEAISKTYDIDAVNQRYQIPIPGFHSAIGVRPYTDLEAGVLGDISKTDGLLRIKTLNQEERSLSFSLLQCINALSSDPTYTGDSFVGTTSSDADFRVNLSGNIADSRKVAQSCGWFDYLTDQTGSDVANLDTVFNTNAFVNLGVTPEIIWDVAGDGSTGAVFMHDRFFGDISGALAKLRILAMQNTAKK